MSESKPVLRRQLQPAIPIDTASMVRWEDRQGNEVALNVPLVRELFKQTHALSDAEILLFLHQARSRRANPFLGDIYAIKYAANAPLAIQAGYHFFMRVAKENSAYDGYDCWCVDSTGKRIADGLEEEEKVVAAVCEVYLKNQSRPVKFVARMKDFNKRQALWVTFAVPMLKKCAIGNAHRHAEPSLANMYLQEEIGQPYLKLEPTEAPPEEQSEHAQESAGPPETPAGNQPSRQDEPEAPGEPGPPETANPGEGPEESRQDVGEAETPPPASADQGVCPTCGKPSKVRRNRKTNEWHLACTDWPDCKWYDPAVAPSPEIESEAPADVPLGPDDRMIEQMTGLTECFHELAEALGKPDLELEVPNGYMQLPRAALEKWIWDKQKQLAAARGVKSDGGGNGDRNRSSD